MGDKKNQKGEGVSKIQKGNKKKSAKKNRICEEKSGDVGNKKGEQTALASERHSQLKKKYEMRCSRTVLKKQNKGGEERGAKAGIDSHVTRVLISGRRRGCKG